MSFNLRSREPRCQKETQQEFNGRAPARFLLPYLPDAGQSALSLWPDMRPLRFRRVPFGRDGAFDPGGATASRMAMPHMLPSTGSERLAPAMLPTRRWRGAGFEPLVPRGDTLRSRAPRRSPESPTMPVADHRARWEKQVLSRLT